MKPGGADLLSLDSGRRLERANVDRSSQYQSKAERLDQRGSRRLNSLESQLIQRYANVAFADIDRCETGPLPNLQNRFHFECGEGELFFFWSRSRRRFILLDFLFRGDGRGGTFGACGPGGDASGGGCDGGGIASDRLAAVALLERLASRSARMLRNEGWGAYTALLASSVGHEVDAGWSALSAHVHAPEQLANPFARSIMVGSLVCRAGADLVRSHPGMLRTEALAQRFAAWMPIPENGSGPLGEDIVVLCVLHACAPSWEAPPVRSRGDDGAPDHRRRTAHAAATWWMDAAGRRHDADLYLDLLKSEVIARVSRQVSTRWRAAEASAGGGVYASRDFFPTFASLGGFVRLCTAFYGETRAPGRSSDHPSRHASPLPWARTSDQDLVGFLDGLARFGAMTDRLADVIAHDGRWDVAHDDRAGLHGRILDLACDLLDAPHAWADAETRNDAAHAHRRPGQPSASVGPPPPRRRASPHARGAPTWDDRTWTGRGKRIEGGDDMDADTGGGMTKGKGPAPSAAMRPFAGADAAARLADELSTQMLVGGIAGLAEDLAAEGELIAVAAGETIIEQGGVEADVFFILAGRFAVIANRREVATRGPGDSVGEMTWISPMQRRSATVTARTEGVVMKASPDLMERLGDKHPKLLRRTAREIAKRLLQRNELMRAPNAKPRVFVISSAEALPVARAIENAFAHDPFLTVVWANGVFRVTSYTLETLERELAAADFAIAIAHPDDVTQVRDVEWPTPRDNVVFELGFFMGSLGRDRAILMEPRGEGVKLPSDLAGITTINYRYEAGADGAALFAPACNSLREHIMALGVRT